jgi:hypothetical protein
MNIEKYRSQLDNPEFVRSFAHLDEANIFPIFERMEERERRENGWRRTRRIILMGSVAVILGLEAFRLFVTNTREPRAQSVAFLLVMAAMFGLTRLDKARPKRAEPQQCHTHLEFLRDEFRRLEKSIHYDRWSSIMLSVGVACLGLYAWPVLSAVPQMACLGATAAAVCLLQFYDQRKIVQVKRSRDEMAQETEALL